MRFGLISTGVSLVAVLAVSGCMSSPTYGTGKTANAQLMEDIGSSMQLTPKKSASIAYEPRPEVLATAKAQGLPEPQQDVTKQAGVWPESPEQKRARLRQEATDAQGDPLFVPKIQNDLPTGNQLALQIAEMNRTGSASSDFKKRKAIAAAGSPTVRKHLSEPPLDYRQPAETAAYGDLGEDEVKKERAARAAAKKGKKWLWPWQ